MRITKKSVENLIQGVNEVTNNLGWRLWKLGAYKKHNKIHLYVAYHGQGLDANVYNGTYDDIVDFEDVYSEYKNKEYNKSQIVNIIYNRILQLTN